MFMAFIGNLSLSQPVLLAFSHFSFQFLLDWILFPVLFYSIPSLSFSDLAQYHQRHSTSSIHTYISREAVLELTDYFTVDQPYQIFQANGGIDHASHPICVLMLVPPWSSLLLHTVPETHCTVVFS